MEEQIVALTQDANADSSPASEADHPSAAPAQIGDSGAPAGPEAPKDQGAGPSGAEKRIQQLVARQREAERREAARSAEAAYWRGIAEGRIKNGGGTPLSPQPFGGVSPQPYSQSPPGAPELPLLANFERSEDFEEARTRYVVEKAKWDLRQELETFRARETQDAIDRRYRERMAAAAISDPELLEIENDATLPVSLPMAIAIKESEAAPSILRYLSAHRDEAARIARLNPIAAAREMGRLEARLSAPTVPQTQTKTVSQAPEPHKPVGGATATIDLDDDKAPIDEFVRRRNAHEREAKTKGTW